MVETGLRDSRCISMGQKSNDLRAIKNEAFVDEWWLTSKRLTASVKFYETRLIAENIFGS